MFFSLVKPWIIAVFRLIFLLLVSLNRYIGQIVRQNGNSFSLPKGSCARRNFRYSPCSTSTDIYVEKYLCFQNNCLLFLDMGLIIPPNLRHRRGTCSQICWKWFISHCYRSKKRESRATCKRVRQWQGLGCSVWYQQSCCYPKLLQIVCSRMRRHYSYQFS